MKLFDIKTYTVLPVDIKSQVKDLKIACFSNVTGQTPEQKIDHLDRFYNKKPAVHIPAFADDKVIGYVAILKRTIIFENHSILLGGIGGVCTLPDMRNRGIASELLTEGMKQLHILGCDIAYLCTNIHYPLHVYLYNKFGFVLYGKPHTYTGKSGKKYIDHDAMLAPIQSPESFELIMNSSNILDIGKGNW